MAAAPAENILMVLSPAQLGVQALEAVHNSTGLPWWLSIPLTTLALRGLLLPLSLRAKAGSSSLLMLDAAFEQSGAILRRITPPPTYAEGASGSAVASPPPPPPLGRLQLVRFSHSYLRKKSGGPGMGWYVGNAALQVGLRREPRRGGLPDVVRVEHDKEGGNRAAETSSRSRNVRPTSILYT